MSKTTTAQPALWQDYLFLAAVLAGPVVWLGLYFIQQPAIQWDWPLIKPWQFLLPVLLYPCLLYTSDAADDDYTV